jgi:hypothetical protein
MSLVAMKVWMRGTLGFLDRVPRGVDVLRGGARQAADHRTVNLAGDGLDRLEVTGRRYGEPGFDHVDSEPRQLVGDLELLLLVQRDARRLLAVAERRVEDLYSVVSVAVHVVPSASSVLPGLLGLRLGGRHALFPPKGEKEKSQVGGARHGPRSVQDGRPSYR